MKLTYAISQLSKKRQEYNADPRIIEYISLQWI
jgi:hypothetical protein